MNTTHRTHGMMYTAEKSCKFVIVHMFVIVEKGTVETCAAVRLTNRRTTCI
jgi:hypothetical protein